MLTELVLFGTILLVLYLYDNHKRGRLYEAAKQFPGPKAYPVLGNSLDFLGNDVLKVLIELGKKYGRFSRIWNNGTLYVVSNDYRDAEVVLGSNVHIDKSDVYRFAKPWVGEGLLTAPVPIWRVDRKIITPTFHFKILEGFLDVFNKNNAILCQKLDSQVGKGEFDICNFIKWAMLDSICETAMGKDMHHQKNSGENQYCKAVKSVLEIISMRTFRVWLMQDFIFYRSKYAKVQNDAIKILHGTTNELIKEKRDAFSKVNLTEAKKTEEDDGDEIYGKKKLAFLDLLLRSAEGAKLSNSQIRAEVDTVLFAGHETLTATLSFAIYSLAHNQKAQEEAYREQLKIFGDSDRPTTNKDIQEMKYLERVIKEAARLYPVVPLVARNINEDLELHGGYKVPKGAQVAIMIFNLHRDPTVWPNPEAFNPDNFLPDRVRGRNPYAYIPFSAGPRNCIGQKYAMIEMKATLSQILRNFKVLPSPKEEDRIQLSFALVLLSKNGVRLQLERRH